MARIVFRADAGPKIGAGHVMRCLALASAYAELGWTIGFAGTVETFASVAPLVSGTMEPLRLACRVDQEPAALAEHWPGGADILVVDHYQRDAEFERACRSWARRIVVLDDLADRPHDCDLLVDSACNSADAYRNLVPARCRVLCGPAYAIVHPRFRQARERALAKRDGGPVKRVLVSFGQVDPANATMDAVRALRAGGFAGEIDIARGGAAPHLAAVRNAAGNGTRLHIDAADMAELMVSADLAIGAGGQTSWERCCLGLPSIVATLASNQEQVVARLVKAGAAVSVGIADCELKSRISAALGDIRHTSDELRAVAQNAASLVDGRGIERVMIAAIGPEVTPNGDAVTLRLAESGDEDWLLLLQIKPETRRHANHRDPPSPEQHHRWMAATLSDSSRLLMIMEVGATRVGVVRLDRGTDADRVSIATDPDYQRHGIGRATLALVPRLSPCRTLEAEILPDNSASQALFARAGYRQIDEKLYRTSHGKE